MTSQPSTAQPTTAQPTAAQPGTVHPTAAQPDGGRSAAAPGSRLDDQAPVFVISVAAELSGMHPQTLRQYDRLGLVTPRRTAGRGRRYSTRDVDRLRQVQHLSQAEGVNLAGIKRILELEDQVAAMAEELERVRELRGSVPEAPSRTRARVFAADRTGQVTPLRRGERPERSGRPGALVLWRPSRRA